MYIPEPFAAPEPEALVAALAAKRLAILVTASEDGAPWATHLPMLWDAETRTLHGHIARANPHPKRASGAQALVILPGADAYVSPSLYPSKAAHGKAVPTWNYEAAHVSGGLEWFDDAKRLEAIVRDLSNRHEAARDQPWRIDDAPRAYIDAMLRGIIGVSVKAERIDAKRKLSQNKSAEDFAGVRDGLAQGREAEREIAAFMAALRP